MSLQPPLYYPYLNYTSGGERFLYVWGRQNTGSILFYPIISYVNNCFPFTGTAIRLPSYFYLLSPFVFLIYTVNYLLLESIWILHLHFVTNSVVGRPESATSMMTKSTIPHEWAVSMKFFPSDTLSFSSIISSVASWMFSVKLCKHFFSSTI